MSRMRQLRAMQTASSEQTARSLQALERNAVDAIDALGVEVDKLSSLVGGNTVVVNGASNPSLVVDGKDKAWEITRNYTKKIVIGTNTVGPILGKDYYEQGDVGGGMSYHVLLAEVEIVGEDGSFAVFSKTYRGLLRKELAAAYTWSVVTGLAEVTDLALNTPAATVSATFNRSGADFGDIAIDIGFNGAADPHAIWIVKVRLLGGGRYV